MLPAASITPHVARRGRARDPGIPAVKDCQLQAARSPGDDWAAGKRLWPEGPIGGAEVTGDSPK